MVRKDQNESDDPGIETPQEKWLGFGLVLMLLGAAAWLFYGSDGYVSSASIAAMVAIPFAIGGLIAQCDTRNTMNLRGCLLYPVLAALLIIGLAALLFREGAICVTILTLPWVIAAIGGAVVSQYNARRRIKKLKSSGFRLKTSLLALIPVLTLGLEFSAPPEWQDYVVEREIRIDASPQEVWPLLIEIPSVQPDEGIYTFTHDILNVPRPSDASLRRTEAELVRIAHWGPDIQFEERIIDLENDKSLSWSFAFTNDSVQRHTDRHIAPDGPDLKIETGKYEIFARAHGKSVVRLSTRYRIRSRMAPYLSMWGDRLLGDVQDNVLAIIADRAERAKPETVNIATSPVPPPAIAS